MAHWNTRFCARLRRLEPPQRGKPSRHFTDLKKATNRLGLCSGILNDGTSLVICCRLVRGARCADGACRETGIQLDRLNAHSLYAAMMSAINGRNKTNQWRAGVSSFTGARFAAALAGDGHSVTGTLQLRIGDYGDLEARRIAMLQAARESGLELGKFIVPNPFGPLEQQRFCTFLVRSWRAGKAAEVRALDYIRDNIPVD